MELLIAYNETHFGNTVTVVGLFVTVVHPVAGRALTIAVSVVSAMRGVTVVSGGVDSVVATSLILWSEDIINEFGSDAVLKMIQSSDICAGCVEDPSSIHTQ